MGLIEDLPSGTIGVDTALFIYFIEAAPPWHAIVSPLFRAADSGRLALVTSAVTLLEVLVVPYRANQPALAARYEALLTRSRGVRLIDITRSQLREAARLRAQTGVRTPDALQLTAAREANCAAFITNDRRLPTLAGLRILQLGDYASSVATPY
jgi:predicted nucleic acid-binding protein